MSKELIEELRANAAALDGDLPGLLMLAADALEAKAAPVGEREAFEAWWQSAEVLVTKRELALAAYQAGAAYQRAQQPQPSAGVVMPERKECDDGYPSDDWLIASAWNACLDEFARLYGKGVV